MHPTRTGSPPSIVFAPVASRFNFKSGIIQLLPTFHDFESENSYLHLREFKGVCSTCTYQNYSMNIIKLKISLSYYRKKLKLGYKILDHDLSELGMKYKHNFWKTSFHPIKQILSKDKSPHLLNNQVKPSINVRMGRRSYLTFVHTTVLKHGG